MSGGSKESKKDTCKVDGCVRDSFWRGYCPSHATEGFNSPDKRGVEPEAIPIHRITAAGGGGDDNKCNTCERVKATFGRASIRELLPCTKCPGCKFSGSSDSSGNGSRSKDQYVVVVYRLNHEEVKDVSLFSFPQGKQDDVVEFLGGRAAAVSVEEPTTPQSRPSEPKTPNNRPSLKLPNQYSKTPLVATPVSAVSSTTTSPTNDASTPSTPSFRKKNSKEQQAASGRRMSTMGRNSAADVEYKASSDLTALDDPRGKVNELITALTSGNWKDEFTALDDVRRLCIWNPNVLSPQQLAKIVRKVDSQVSSNLRSSVRKNGVLCIQAMFCTIGKPLEPYLHLLVPTLIKRTIESNNFLAGESEVALRAMTMTVSPLKAMKVCLGIANTTVEKDFPLKSQALKTLAWCVEQYGTAVYEHKNMLEQLVKCIAPALYEKSKSTRAHARDCAFVLVRLLSGNDDTDFDIDAGVALFQSVVEKTPLKFRERLTQGLAQSGAVFNEEGQMTLQRDFVSPVTSPVSSPILTTRSLIDQ